MLPRHVDKDKEHARGLALCVWLLVAIRGAGTPLDQGVRCCDPAVIASQTGQVVYVFGTGGRLPFWRSADLREWTRVGNVFPESVPEWATEKVPQASGFWAPDVSFFNGRYHVYYSVSSWGSQRSVIGLTVGKTLDPASRDYGWEDQGLVVESAPGTTDFNAIDAALFVDTDGAPYLFWGSFWSGIKAAGIDRKTGKIPSGARIVPIAGRARGVEPPSIEGAYVIRAGAWYYLFVSWGLTCQGKQSTYRVMVGRSASVLGPYVDIAGVRMLEGGGTLVLASHDANFGPGHNSVLQTRAGDWMFHHIEGGEAKGSPRLLQVRPIHWLEEWPVVGEPLQGTGQPRQTRLAVKDFIGRWQHRVDYGFKEDIVLGADGSIVGTAGRWAYEKGCVVFRRPGSEAPGGVWVDRVVVGYDGRSYVGRNQRGQVIQGVRE